MNLIEQLEEIEIFTLKTASMYADNDSVIQVVSKLVSNQKKIALEIEGLKRQMMKTQRIGQLK